MSKRRVVVTGMGAITPIGNSVEEFWEGIKVGKNGIGMIDYFDTTEFKVKIAAEVKDFEPKNYMDPRQARRMGQFSRFAVAAAGEAIKDSGLDMEKEDPFRVGCIVSSGVGDLSTFEKEHTNLMERGPKRVGILFVPTIISNMASGNVAIAYGLKGKNISVTTACATGTHSIGEALRTIQYGDADVMLAGGAESCICPIGVAGFTSLTALSESTDVTRASIPFDKERNGFVMGEGAGVLILEELEHALARGANIYAEIIGYGATCDAYHITSPAEDGSGASMAMEMAVKDGGIELSQVDYINAHGTSTHHNDLFETRAIRKVFGDHADELLVNSTKSMVGHMLGAAGAVEEIAVIKEIQEGWVHPTIGFKVTDEECDLNYVPGKGVERDVKYALSNSFGFGGHNACILTKKWEA
ncbi:MAG: beta-ketoacyl-ACP synthase II [Lachnospiraceae bacterium]